MTNWETFFKEKSIAIFNTSVNVLDIGECLRARQGTGSKFDPKHAWLQEYIKKVNYKVMDPVPDYKPDIVGDIHSIPLAGETIDGIFCLAVLEHVKDPVRAMEELYRILKPGGKILIYVPFLYYYHAHPGYFQDYWRFTYDTLVGFAEKYSKYEIVPVRLPIETLAHLTPILNRLHFFILFARLLDTVFCAKRESRQVGGYYLYLQK
jgi:SAM-dependent methyltransferase